MKERHDIHSLRDIVVDGQSIFIARYGEFEKLPVSGSMAEKQDWDALVEWLKQEALPA